MKIHLNSILATAIQNNNNIQLEYTNKVNNVEHVLIWSNNIYTIKYNNIEKIKKEIDEFIENHHDYFIKMMINDLTYDLQNYSYIIHTPWSTK
jgi:hypothetical protein